MRIDLEPEAHSIPKPTAKSESSPLYKSLGGCPALVVALLLTGCASQPPLVLDPVGPAPLASTAAGSPHGALMVYSPCVAIVNLSAELSGETSDDWEYSNYKILSSDGKRFKSVSNNTGTVQLHPQTVALPAGRYIVVAKASGGLHVMVPVVIVDHRITVLRLDGSDFSPDESGLNETNTVQLPDGRVVGWRADRENVPAS
ncbi:MAG TPA: hypothetical protein VGO57_05720 [Verrucomicrobiae bacterium]|jgi:hypothetical protein